MFGSKLRSWMEAVRSRKKQHRKEKQSKCNLENNRKCFGKGDTDSKFLKDEYKVNIHFKTIILIFYVLPMI